MRVHDAHALSSYSQTRDYPFLAGFPHPLLVSFPICGMLQICPDCTASERFVKEILGFRSKYFQKYVVATSGKRRIATISPKKGLAKTAVSVDNGGMDNIESSRFCNMKPMVGVSLSARTAACLCASIAPASFL